VFERFTEEARQVVVLAQEEARTLSHAYIGTEHILLGLLRQEEKDHDGEPLHTLGITLSEARRRVRRIVSAGEGPQSGQIPFTPRAKKVLELSLREALSLGHNYIGPEHILLGLAREDEGVAARVLLEFDVDSEKIRGLVIETLGSKPVPARAARAVSGLVGRPPFEAKWLDALRSVLVRLAPEIREELGRDPDDGDLLLVMASARESLAGEALQVTGVDLDALWGTLELIRQRRTEERTAQTRRIDELRAKKEQALEEQDFAEAARHRDEQREAQRAPGLPWVGPEAVREIRRRLGLPEADS
jgi:hypothetical protein